MADDLPSFVFSEEEIAAIKASVGATDVDETQGVPISEVRPRRKPGRPRKEPVLVISDSSGPELKSPAIPLTKREEREVAERLTNILAGATGMGGVVKPYIPMTDEEAKAIAEPLASYLIRNEATSGVAREILQNYDLVAMTLGVGSYAVRVYSDRKRELESQRPDNTTAIQRLSERQDSDNGRGPDEGNSAFVSTPSITRGGPTPFDV